MSISANPRRNDYVGNGSVATYSYNFKIFSKTDLLVKRRQPTSPYTESTLVEGVDYSVAGIGLANGGSITLLLGNLANLYSLSLIGRMPVAQGTNIGNDGNFYPDVVELGLDKQAIIGQQQQEQLSRTLKLPDSISSALFDATLPPAILDPANASQAIIINATNDGFEVGQAGTSAAAVAAAAAATAAAASASASAAAAAAAVSAATIAPVVVAVDTSGGDVPQSLPSAAANPDTFYYLINIPGSAFNINVSPTGGDQIHGQGSDTITPGSNGKYWSDGVSSWYSLN